MMNDKENIGYAKNMSKQFSQEDIAWEYKEYSEYCQDAEIFNHSFHEKKFNPIFLDKNEYKKFYLYKHYKINENLTLSEIRKFLKCIAFVKSFLSYIRNESNLNNAVQDIMQDEIRCRHENYNNDCEDAIEINEKFKQKLNPILLTEEEYKKFYILQSYKTNVDFTSEEIGKFEQCQNFITHFQQIKNRLSSKQQIFWKSEKFENKPDRKTLDSHPANNDTIQHSAAYTT